MPYCKAGRPVLGERKTRLSTWREISTGKVALSVKPAASEINLGRDKRGLHEPGNGRRRGAAAHGGQGGFHLRFTLTLNIQRRIQRKS